MARKRSSSGTLRCRAATGQLSEHRRREAQFAPIGTQATPLILGLNQYARCASSQRRMAAIEFDIPTPTHLNRSTIIRTERLAVVRCWRSMVCR